MVSFDPIFGPARGMVVTLIWKAMTSVREARNSKIVRYTYAKGEACECEC